MFIVSRHKIFCVLVHSHILLSFLFLFSFYPFQRAWVKLLVYWSYSCHKHAFHFLKSSGSLVLLSFVSQLWSSKKKGSGEVVKVVKVRHDAEREKGVGDVNQDGNSGMLRPQRHSVKPIKGWLTSQEKFVLLNQNLCETLRHWPHAPMLNCKHTLSNSP